jgi:hypothetical protein
VNLRYTPDAPSIRDRHRWWRTNRDKAPGLFARELRAALRKLRDNTDAARQWRLLMPKTRHHVYYQRDEHVNVATVLLVANAIALAGPDLSARRCTPTKRNSPSALISLDPEGATVERHELNASSSVQYAWRPVGVALFNKLARFACPMGLEPVSNAASGYWRRAQ